VQNILSSSLLTKNVKIKIYRSIILHIFCMSVKLGIWHLREERKLLVFESLVLRKIFRLKRDEVTGY
jgi:hypothetical protein